MLVLIFTFFFPNQIKTLHRKKARSYLNQARSLIKMRPNEVERALVPVIGAHGRGFYH
jgi:hypothetical protein